MVFALLFFPIVENGLFNAKFNSNDVPLAFPYICSNLFDYDWFEIYTMSPKTAWFMTNYASF